MLKFFRPSCLWLAAGSLLSGGALAQTLPPATDFSGIWQINDKNSDSAADIGQRLHAEKRRETAPSSRPAGASSSADSTASSNNSGRHGGHGMGGGGGGMGGGGRHGNRDSQDDLSSGGNKQPKDPTPPLFGNDGLLNVQQSGKGIRVDFNNTDRLDTQFDGIPRQSLSGGAQVQTRMTPDGMQVSMQFDDGNRLDESWARSMDGHHLSVTETWTTTAVTAPIVFKRSYDRLDL